MIGRIVSHYEIREKLGEGGMGVVYKAHDTKLDRDVALKFLSSPVVLSEEKKQRFIQEAKTASTLDHPNICNIYEIDETPTGEMFIAMRSYDGMPLSKKISEDPLSIQQIVSYALQIVSGLQAAHEKDIIHRDIKSGNIIVTEKDEIKIIDFGLAKLRGEAQITKTGKAVGSLAYMSPEQLRADAVDARSDIFSLGVVLYEMITGTLPFKGEYEEVVMYSIIYQDPTSVSDLRSDVPVDLEEVVMKCLQKDPEGRYQNTTDLLHDLKRIQHRLEGRSTVYDTGTRTRSSVSNEWVPYLHKPVIIGIVIFLIMIVLAYPYIGQFIGTIGSREALPQDKYLAVLPFRTIGNNPDDEIFNYGLMDILTSKITQMEIAHGSFWIVPSHELRDRGVTSASEAQRIFGVTLVVDGTIYRDEEEIHVTLNLIDTETLRQIDSWHTVIDKNNITVLSNDMTIQLAKMLNVEFQPHDMRMITRGATQDPRAYELYIKAIGVLQQYERVEDIEEALSLFNQALEIDRSYALAYAGIGEAYWRMYDETKEHRWVDLAVENCTRALELNDNLAAAYVSLGLVLRGTGEYERAIESFKQAIEINPVNAAAYKELAKAFEQSGEFAEAENTYHQVIRLRPADWTGYNVLGGFYFNRARYDDAIKQYTKVTELTPDNPTGYLNLGAVHFELENWPQAREYLERAHEIEPRFSIYSNLGTIYFYEAMYDKAIEAYEQALQIREHDYRIWGYLASASYWAGKDEQKVIDLYRQAIAMAEHEKEVNPRNPPLLVRLAGYCVMVGDSAGAGNYLEEALQLSPNDVSVLSAAVPVYEQLGERNRALSLLTDALTEGATVAYFENDPVLKQLREDPKYQQLVEEINSLK